jgi:hypothetical protein
LDKLEQRRRGEGGREGGREGGKKGRGITRIGYHRATRSTSIIFLPLLQVQQIITRYYIYICDSRSRDIFLGILYGYKALLQIIAMIFAFSIRKVKVKGLNDTKFIVAIVYVTSIATATIIVAAYTLNTKINGYAALFSAAIVIGTTTTLGLVFVPKVRLVGLKIASYSYIEIFHGDYVR